MQIRFSCSMVLSSLIGFLLLIPLSNGCANGTAKPDAEDEGRDGSEDDATIADENESLAEEDRTLVDDDGAESDDIQKDGADAADGNESDDGADAEDELWSWCPLASDYVGGDWPWALQVRSGTAPDSRQ